MKKRPLSLKCPYECQQEVLLGQQLAKQCECLLNVGLDLNKSAVTDGQHDNSV